MNNRELVQTGRTNRMLGEAHRLARIGEQVYVIGLDDRHTMNLFNRGPRHPQIEFCAIRDLPTFDWEIMRVPDAPEYVTFFVDHSVTESRFAAMRKMQHRFDLQGRAHPEGQADLKDAVESALGHYPLTLENILSVIELTAQLSAVGISAADILREESTDR